VFQPVGVIFNAVEFRRRLRDTNDGRYTREAARWQDRLKRLTPPKLRAIVAGEKAPYPSSIGKR
jgi:hypothetical protein